MPYIIEKHEEQLVDAISSPKSWAERNPIYKSMFEFNADMRNQHQEQNTMIKTPEWKLVAKLQSPVMDVNKLLNTDFFRDKRAFYGWLDRNPQYCVYDRRRGRRV